MKRIVNGFWMSLSMFSILPAPMIWDEKSFCWVMPAFPAVGVIIGGVWYAAARLWAACGLPDMLGAAVLLLTPLFLSGFIHIDGYMDTSDALGSRACLEKKRIILKDSHVGAFAVISLAVYIILGFASTFSIVVKNNGFTSFIFIPIFSRIFTAIALLVAKPMSDTGFANAFRQNKKTCHLISLAAFGAISTIAALIAGGFIMICIIAVSMLAGITSFFCLKKQFDGISGDLCGFIITVCELCSLMILAVV